jgi:hypothetical protein
MLSAEASKPATGRRIFFIELYLILCVLIESIVVLSFLDERAHYHPLLPLPQWGEL